MHNLSFLKIKPWIFLNKFLFNFIFNFLQFLCLIHYQTIEQKDFCLQKLKIIIFSSIIHCYYTILFHINDENVILKNLQIYKNIL